MGRLHIKEIPSMKKAKMILDRDFAIGQIDKRLYGSFI